MKGLALAALLVLVGGSATAAASEDVKELESNCDAGNLEACVKLGREFAKFAPVWLGLDKDYARAVPLFQTACEGGSAAGCSHLADCYRRGIGVQEDLTRALSLYEKACEGEFADGCFRLGQAYAKGEGVPEDDTLAVSGYERACEFGKTLACLEAARFYHPNSVLAGGTLRDATKWPTFWEKACDDPMEQGRYCLKLGLLFDLGMWVAKDTNRATELFKKGCFYESKEACDLINR
jgi:TPR repeat protein